MRRTVLAAFLPTLLLGLLPRHALGAGETLAPTSAPAAQVAIGSMPVVLVRLAEDKLPVPLGVVKAEVQVEIVGCLALTIQTLTFRNDTPRVLEGELVFPLPEGASVTGYGLDIQGEIVDGVPVEKHEARIAYEKEVRKGIDPGLVEFVKGNNFRTRIYPIPANGTRTVKVQYASELLTRGTQNIYHLPLNFTQRLDLFKLTIEVAKTPGADKPEVAEGDDDLGRMAFTEAQGKYTATLAAEKFLPKKDLLIAIPLRTAAAEVVEQDPSGKEFYFMMTCFTAMPPVGPVPKPQCIAIAWDASLSRADQDNSREFAILGKLLQQLGDVEVHVVVFRDTVDQPVTFQVTKGDATPLVNFLKALTYDGATDLGSLKLAANPVDLGLPAKRPQPPYDYWLLFTDGMGNLGEDMPKVIEAPVYTITGATSVNHALLHYIADKSGGQYLNLAKSTDAQALNAIGAPAFGFLRAEFDPKEIAEVYPATKQAVNGRFTLCGRLLAPEAKLTVVCGWLGHGGRPQFAPRASDATTQSTVHLISDEVFYTLKQSDAAPVSTSGGSIVARYWAQQKVNDLALFEDKNHDELLALGRRFNIVTPSTSLLVLDTLEQYLQYGIAPPKTRKDMYEKWTATVEKQQVAEKKTRQDKIEQVVAMWKHKAEWWEKEYKYQKGFKWTEPVAKQGSGGGASFGAPGRATTQPDLTLAPVLDLAAVAPAAPPAPHDPAAPSAGEGRAGGHADDWVIGRVVSRGDGGYVYRGSEAYFSKTDDEKSVAAGSQSAIAVKAWDPKTPYLEAIKSAPANKAYDTFLEQRKQYSSSPAFYFDCADWFLRHEQKALGLRILTDVIELRLESPQLLRIVGYRMQQEGQLDLAINVFEKVFKLRLEEPQSYRDLALALGARADNNASRPIPMFDPGDPPERFRAHVDGWGNLAMATMDFERALNLLNEIVVRPWDGRFPEIEMVALMDANRIADRVEKFRGLKPVAIPFDARLRKTLDCDVRITLAWDTDLTDVDLWVTEPSGEKCFYQHAQTTIGGAISRDFTQGYGPEEYCVRRAMPGSYKVQANFFGSRQQTLSGPTTVVATVITNFGRPNEKRQLLTLRLSDVKEVFDVGSINWGNPG